MEEKIQSGKARIVPRPDISSLRISQSANQPHIFLLSSGCPTLCMPSICLRLAAPSARGQRQRGMRRLFWHLMGICISPALPAAFPARLRTLPLRLPRPAVHKRFTGTKSLSTGAADGLSRAGKAAGPICMCSAAPLLQVRSRSDCRSQRCINDLQDQIAKHRGGRRPELRRGKRQGQSACAALRCFFRYALAPTAAASGA